MPTAILNDTGPTPERPHPVRRLEGEPEPKHLSLLRPVASPDQIAQAHQEVSALIVQSLKEEQDYGRIPGAGDKQVLLKPGAERLAIAFGCRVEYAIVEKEVDHDRPIAFTLAKWMASDRRPPKEEAERLKLQGLGRWRKGFGGKWVWQVKQEERGEALGLYRYVIRCRLVRHDGLVVGDAIGACSSLESRYIRQPRDSENTIVKMAQKRALVAVALNAFGLSDRFSQDLEEGADVIDLEPGGGPVGAARGHDQAQRETARTEKVRSRRSPAHAAVRPQGPPALEGGAALADLLTGAPEGDDEGAYRRYFEAHKAGLNRGEQAALRAWLYALRNAARGRPEEEDNDPAALAVARRRLAAPAKQREAMLGAASAAALASRPEEAPLRPNDELNRLYLLRKARLEGPAPSPSRRVALRLGLT